MGDLGYWDKNGNLGFMGRKAECIKTKNGPIETERYEPFVNTIDGIKRCALIGIGDGTIKEPSLVVEMSTRLQYSPSGIIKKMRSALSQKFPEHDIQRIFVQKKLPVDSRHNAKIHRLSLAKKWTRKVKKNQKLGMQS